MYVREPEPEVVQIEVAIEWTKERIDTEIETVAERYKVSPDIMRRVVACESHGSTTIQSYHKRPDGTREQSFGLVQIHLPDWPMISKEQALDPAFALDFLGSKLKEGKGNLWTCYRKLAP